METSHHTNGHTSVKKIAHTLAPVAKKVGARRAVKRAVRASKRVEHKALATERKLESSARGLVAWAKANPKTAIGVGLGASVVLGALASNRFVRASVLGLAALSIATFRRFV
jgi:hypothetical protein